MPKMPGWIKSLFAVALFVFCGAFATASGAATRYVSTTGDNTSNDCTNANNACATIAYAINQSNPGDTVQVAAGTYTEHGITVDRNLTIAGDSAAATVVQAAATQASATERVFHIGTGTTVTISGLTIRNGGKTGFTADAEGGGIYNDHAILTIANCTVTSKGYNLSSDGTGPNNGTSDQINPNPMLGPLAYYGGPTATHILLTGSPAINKGKNLSGATTDQRGFARTVGSAAVTDGDGTDIGAFERQPNDIEPTLVVTT